MSTGTFVLCEGPGTGPTENCGSTAGGRPNGEKMHRNNATEVRWLPDDNPSRHDTNVAIAMAVDVNMNGRMPKFR
jgi:hypothetical protein